MDRDLCHDSIAANMSVGFAYEFPPRLMVKGRSQSGSRKGYFWQIARDDGADSVPKESGCSYRTMEEAYIPGSAALRRQFQCERRQ